MPEQSNVSRATSRARSTTRSNPALILALLAACAGCAAPAGAGATLPQPAAPTPANAPEAAPAGAAAERLTLRVSGKTWLDARLDGTRMRGVSHDVAHFDDGYRGRSPRGHLFLSEQQRGHVSGVIGTNALTVYDYRVDPSSGRISAEGRWAGRSFGLEVDRDRVNVSGRWCSETYQRGSDASDVFIAAGDCWYGRRRTTKLSKHLRVPDAFFERPAGEQIVFLAAFLM